MDLCLVELSRIEDGVLLSFEAITAAIVHFVAFWVLTPCDYSVLQAQRPQGVQQSVSSE
jgi:hypothetical protein